MSVRCMDWAFRHSRATGSAFTLLLAICDEASNDGRVWQHGIRRTHWADKARLSKSDASEASKVRNITRRLRELEELGEVLVIQRPGRGRPNGYLLPAYRRHAGIEAEDQKGDRDVTLTATDPPDPPAPPGEDGSGGDPADETLDLVGGEPAGDPPAPTAAKGDPEVTLTSKGDRKVTLTQKGDRTVPDRVTEKSGPIDDPLICPVSTPHHHQVVDTVEGGGGAAIDDDAGGGGREAYVEDVLRVYARLPLTPDRPSIEDRELAGRWYDEGRPIEQVLGLLSLIHGRAHHSAVARIRSLSYFASAWEQLVAEADGDLDPEYLEHHGRRLAVGGDR